MPKNKGWFRLYDRMLDSSDILDLNDSEFRVLISIWCLASQGGSEDGKVLYRNGALWKRISPQMRKDAFERILLRLLETGLLLGEDGKYLVKDWSRHQFLFDSYKPSVRKLKRDSLSKDRQENVKPLSNDCQAIVKQDTDSDTDSDTDTEKEKEKIYPPLPPTGGKSRKRDPISLSKTDIVTAYHDNCPMLPRVLVWNDRRDRMLKARISENAGRRELSWWVEFFRFVATSKFLTGQTEPLEGRRPFFADLEWLLSPSNMAKVIEGKYHRGEDDDDPPHYRVVGEYE